MSHHYVKPDVHVIAGHLFLKLDCSEPRHLVCPIQVVPSDKATTHGSHESS